MKEPREGASSSPPLAVQLVEALDLQQTFLAGGAVDDDAVHNRRKTRKLARRGLVTQPKDCEEAARGRVW